MTTSMLFDFFVWTSIVNTAILFFWAFMFMLSGSWIYKIHSKWFTISRKQFDLTHYKGLAYFKLLIFVFNYAPLLALWKLTNG